jgi:hypothetical protein
MVSRDEWEAWRRNLAQLRQWAHEVVAVTRNERHHAVLQRALFKKRGQIRCYNPTVPQITAIILTLILDRPMCVECIAGRAQVSIPTIKDHVDRMRATVRIQDGSGRCRTCGRFDQPVFWLSESPGDPPPE